MKHRSLATRCRVALWTLVSTAAVGGATPAAAETVTPTVPQAIALFQQQDYAGAADMLRQVTQAEPENGRAWVLLGTALQKHGDLDAALEANAKALRIDSVAPRAMYNTACVYALQGKKSKAFKWLKKVKATGKVDLTAIPFDPDLASLIDDPRLAGLMPSERRFREPFVEPTRIVHEWDGEAGGDQFGWIARDIGDVDGDGIHDLTTSAPTKEVDGKQAGRVYVYSGREGTLLWHRSGKPGDQLGLGIEAAGDVNDDGIPDVVAGAPGNDRVLVFSGRDGTVLLELSGSESGETFGRKVSDLGDLNGDGHDDVLVGAPTHDHEGQDAGRAAVYSGRDGSILVEWFGERAGDQFGSAGAGLVDDRGAWIVVGAPNAGEGNRGRVYVYAGAEREPRFVIDSDESGANLGGMFVSVVGDVDADGAPDVYASDWSHNAKGRSTGRIYVHSGRDGSRLLELTGESAGDGFGIGPADAGDVDGDGHDDLVIGAWQHGSAAPSAGKVYLYSGQDGSLIRAWTCQVPGDTFGFDATGMGDVDGDGAIDFLLTSAWSAVRGSRSGRMFILAGGP